MTSALRRSAWRSSSGRRRFSSTGSSLPAGGERLGHRAGSRSPGCGVRGRRSRRTRAAPTPAGAAPSRRAAPPPRRPADSEAKLVTVASSRQVFGKSNCTSVATTWLPVRQRLPEGRVQGVALRRRRPPSRPSDLLRPHPERALRGEVAAREQTLAHRSPAPPRRGARGSSRPCCVSAWLSARIWRSCEAISLNCSANTVSSSVPRGRARAPPARLCAKLRAARSRSRDGGGQSARELQAEQQRQPHPDQREGEDHVAGSRPSAASTWCRGTARRTTPRAVSPAPHREET